MGWRDLLLKPGERRPVRRNLDGMDIDARRGMAHRAFDLIWTEGHMSRGQAYAWLSSRLGVPPSRAHMSSMDEETCQRVVDVCLEYLDGRPKP